MPDFTYTALASTGAKTLGTLTAATSAAAAQMLDAKGLFPVTITEAAGTGPAGGRFRRGVSNRQLAVFYGQLADLIHAGVPLLRSLEILERQGTNPRLAQVLREVRMKVADGTGLAQALAAYPHIFSELAVSMVRAGQEGGFLEDVLKRVAVFVEHQEDLKSKVIGALAYPAFLAVIGFLVLNVLVIVFVPKFEPIFAKLKEKGQLPDLTVGLIGMSHFLQSGPGILMAVGGLVALVGFFRWTTAGPAGTGPTAGGSASPCSGAYSWPCRCPGSPASWAPYCTTASRSCGPWTSPKTRPGTGC